MATLSDLTKQLETEVGNLTSRKNVVDLKYVEYTKATRELDTVRAKIQTLRNEIEKELANLGVENPDPRVRVSE
jgi:hypothetical protein